MFLQVEKCIDGEIDVKGPNFSSWVISRQRSHEYLTEIQNYHQGLKRALKLMTSEGFHLDS